MANSILEEYKICQSMIQHLDTINWSVGAILFGSSLAATGLILREPTFIRLLALLTLSAVFLVGWLFFVKRQTGFKDICAAIMAEIETENPTLKIKRQQYIDHAKKDGCVKIGDRCVKLFPTSSFRIFIGMVVLYLLLLIILTSASLYGLLS